MGDVALIPGSASNDTAASTSQWDAADYARVGGFVPALGQALGIGWLSESVLANEDLAWVAIVIVTGASGTPGGIDALSLLGHRTVGVALPGHGATDAQFALDYQVTGRFGECLDRLKDRLADPVGDRVIEGLRLAREVGLSNASAEEVFNVVPPPLIYEWTNPRYTYSLVKGGPLYQRLGFLAAYMARYGIIPQTVELDDAMDMSLIAEVLKGRKPP